MQLNDSLLSDRNQPYVGLSPINSKSRTSRYHPRTFNLQSKLQNSESTNRSTFQPRETHSSLRWELKSKDSHLGKLLKHESKIMNRLKKEQYLAQIYHEF